MIAECQTEFLVLLNHARPKEDKEWRACVCVWGATTLYMYILVKNY